MRGTTWHQKIALLRRASEAADGLRVQMEQNSWSDRSEQDVKLDTP